MRGEFTDCSFTNNEADEGGALYGTIDLQGGWVVENSARLGGGIRLTTLPMLLTGAVIQQNTATQSGAGLYISGHNAVLSELLIVGNESSGVGGGVSIDLPPASADAVCPSIPPHLDWQDVEVRQNYAATNGGGLYMAAYHARVDGLDIVDNEAFQDGGGAALVRYDSSHSACSGPRLFGSLIRENRAANGGGVEMTSSARVENSAIYGNSAVQAGGGIRLKDGEPVDPSAALINLSMDGNTAAMRPGIDARIDVEIRNCALWGHAGDDVAETAGTVTFRNNCSEEAFDPDPSNTLLTASPFEPGPDGEPRLLDSAVACIDGADSTVAPSYFDWENMTTRVSGALDAAPMDAGAHYPAPAP